MRYLNVSSLGEFLETTYSLGLDALCFGAGAAAMFLVKNGRMLLGLAALLAVAAFDFMLLVAEACLSSLEPHEHKSIASFWLPSLLFGVGEHFQSS